MASEVTGHLMKLMIFDKWPASWFIFCSSWAMAIHSLPLRYTMLRAVLAVACCFVKGSTA